MQTATVDTRAMDAAAPPVFITPLTMRVGHKSYPIKSVEQASLMFCHARDAALHASDVPVDKSTTALIYDGTGRQVAYVSWSGKVWPGKPTGPFVPGRKPLCDAQG